MTSRTQQQRPQTFDRLICRICSSKPGGDQDFADFALRFSKRHFDGRSGVAWVSVSCDRAAELDRSLCLGWPCIPRSPNGARAGLRCGTSSTWIQVGTGKGLVSSPGIRKEDFFGFLGT